MVPFNTYAWLIPVSMLLPLIPDHMKMKEMINYSKLFYRPHKENMQNYLGKIHGNLSTIGSVDLYED